MYPEWKSSAINPDFFIEEYTEYKKLQELSELLDGKSVAIVGPSSHIQGEGLGDYIDSFDVVIKVGFLETPSPNISIDYGKRNDIVIHSFNSLEIPVAKQNTDYLKKSKFVVCGMVSNDFIEEHENFFNYLRSLGCNVINMEDPYLYGFFRKVGTICNLGTIGIDTILKYDIDSLFITGINFYNMGKYGKVYNDYYFDVVSTKMGIYRKNTKDDITPESARSDLHEQEPQIEYFKRLVNSDSRIILDKYLKENLFNS